jgi:hypothetical protein
MNEPKICKICGKTFFARVHNQLCCRPECSLQNAKNHEKARHGNLKKVKEKICPICGKKFTGNVISRKYCCEECSQIARKRREQKRLDRVRGRAMEVRFCEICGNRLSRAQKSYCSKECWAKARKKIKQNESDIWAKERAKEKHEKETRIKSLSKKCTKYFLERFAGSESMLSIVEVMRQCKANGYGNNYGQFIQSGLLKMPKVDGLEVIGIEGEEDGKN